jgi:hypothetical protein
MIPDADGQGGQPMHSNALRVRLSPNLRDAIGEAARARGMTVSTWMRHAALTRAMLVASDIRADGKRRYARIEGGAIVDVLYHDGEVA